MKPIIISINSLINCDKQTTFKNFYQLDKFLRWYNDPPKLIIESLNDFSCQQIGYKQAILLANRTIQFQIEVLEVSLNDFIRGRISGFLNGSFNWEFKETKKGTYIHKEIIFTGNGFLRHLVALILVRIGDHLHCKKAFKRLNSIVSEKDKLITD